jgi:hypothetical protein
LPAGAQKQKRLAAKFIATNPYAYWRRGRDSNPRYLTVRLISSRTKSIFHAVD